MHGHHVHEAVLESFRKGEITHTSVTMHFVTSQYDQGPIFFRHDLPLEGNDTADSIGSRVNACEHTYQPEVTDLVLRGAITWNGKDPQSLIPYRPCADF